MAGVQRCNFVSDDDTDIFYNDKVINGAFIRAQQATQLPGMYLEVDDSQNYIFQDKYN